jgi:hypothetical protein
MCIKVEGGRGLTVLTIQLNNTYIQSKFAWSKQQNVRSYSNHSPNGQVAPPTNTSVAEQLRKGPNYS